MLKLNKHKLSLGIYRKGGRIINRVRDIGYLLAFQLRGDDLCK